MTNGGHDIKVYGFTGTDHEQPAIRISALGDGGEIQTFRFHPIHAEQFAKAIMGAAHMATHVGGDSRIVIDITEDNHAEEGAR